MMECIISSGARRISSSNLPKRLVAGSELSKQLCRKNSSTPSQGSVDERDDFSELMQRNYTYEDVLSSAPIRLLKSALISYLPRNQNNLGPERTSGLLHLGYQHAYFRPYLDPSLLCDDGTDSKFLPGSRHVWKFRLWAGGSVTLHSRVPPSLKKRLKANVVEKVTDVRVVEEGGRAERVFVSICRQFMMQGTKSYNQLHEITEKDANAPFMTEIEKICFLHARPASLRDERRIKPYSNPSFTLTMTPTPSLLFQFSALTHNAHKIHFDREFARQTYGAEDLVVHGPLTQVLMVEFLRRHLQSSVSSPSIVVIPTNITYTNLQPLYADEPLTLCCKPATESTNASIQEATHWTVWIQKGKGENASMAVKATIMAKFFDFANEP